MTLFETSPRNPGYPCPTQVVSWYHLALYLARSGRTWPRSSWIWLNLARSDPDPGGSGSDPSFRFLLGMQKYKAWPGNLRPNLNLQILRNRELAIFENRPWHFLPRILKSGVILQNRLKFYVFLFWIILFLHLVIVWNHLIYFHLHFHFHVHSDHLKVQYPFFKSIDYFLHFLILSFLSNSHHK